MGRKKTLKKTPSGEKASPGGQAAEGPSSKRLKKSKTAEVDVAAALPSYSSGDDTDEDYAVFLQTYDPQETYPGDLPAAKGKSSRKKAVAKPKKKAA
ncbi:hypothetical protein L195_g001957 [Trifolium pratense]|uniref:Uncharacterized protein n=1 Tax=Trifolium pratense TaxID=57577 RepID=A0A2K3NR45_TRIPR|nr:hypothetical protein L195_g001957 [Trifolium pratense]